MRRLWRQIFIIISLIGLPALANSNNNLPPVELENRLEIPELPSPKIKPTLPSIDSCPLKFQRPHTPTADTSIWLPMFCREYYQAPDFSGVAGLPAGQPLIPIIICRDPLDPEKFEDKTDIVLNYQIDNSLTLMINTYWQLIMSSQRASDSDRHTWLTIVMVLELYSLNGHADQPEWWGCLRSDDEAWLRGAREAIKRRFDNRINNLQREIHLLFD